MAEKIQVTIKGSYDSNVKALAAVQYQKAHNNDGDVNAEEVYTECYSLVNSWRSMVVKKQVEATDAQVTEVSKLLKRAKEANTEEQVLQYKEALMNIISVNRKKKSGPSKAKLYEKILSYCDANNIDVKAFADELVAYYED